MPTVTVQLGARCAGGGHVEVLTLVDGVVQPQLTRTAQVQDLIAENAAKTVEQAARELFARVPAAVDFNTLKASVEALQTPLAEAQRPRPADVTPGEVEPGQPVADVSAEARRGPR